jgi:cytochrome c-type biogenesis protein CcmF
LSREGALVANNLLLVTMLAVIFIGTLYPMALAGLTGQQISVGPPYFNRALTPLLLVMAVLMAVGPWLGWRQSRTAHLPRVLAPAAAVAALGAAIALFGFGVRSIPALLGFGAAAWLMAGSAELVFRRGLTLATLGMALAHFGVGVAMLGATASSALSREQLVVMRVGDRVAFGPWAVELSDVRPVAGPNWTAIEARLAFHGAGGRVAHVAPQSRTYTMPPTETTEAGIAPLWNGDLYAVLGKADGQGGWQVNLRFKPLVRLIWLGGGLIALGGVVALGNARRLRRLSARTATAAA